MNFGGMGIFLISQTVIPSILTDTTRHNIHNNWFSSENLDQSLLWSIFFYVLQPKMYQIDMIPPVT